MTFIRNIDGNWYLNRTLPLGCFCVLARNDLVHVDLPPGCLHVSGEVHHQVQLGVILAGQLVRALWNPPGCNCLHRDKLIISSILQQYVLTLPSFSFKVSACQHFGLEPCTPSKVSAVSIFWLKPPTSPPPKHADIILEHSLTICKVSLDFFFFWVGLPRKFFDGHNKQFKDVSFA